MCIYKKLFVVIIFISSQAIPHSLNPVQSPRENRLYGRVYVQQASVQQRIYVPLHNLKIEILELSKSTQPDGKVIKTVGKMVKSSYPDPDGYFTFINIQKGDYFIRVSWLNVTSNQRCWNILYQKEINVVYINHRTKLSPIEVRIDRPKKNINLRAINTSKYVGGKNPWIWEIYLVAPKTIIDNINCVEYTLHPTFKKRVWMVCRDWRFTQKYPFKLVPIKGWGTFNVSIKVFFKDKKICELNHYLVFK